MTQPNNLFSLFAKLANDTAIYDWPGNGALSHLVCRWLQFQSTWRKQAAKAGTLQMPVSHANYLDERDAHSLPAWWASLWCEAHDRAIPIHMGRVNTNERLAGVAQQVGAATVDGTLLAFGPDKNLKVLEHMLDYLNVRNKDLGEQRYPELGRFPNDRELHEVALDPDVHSVHDLGAYMPAASAVDAIRRNFRMPALKGYRRRHPKKNAS